MFSWGGDNRLTLTRRIVMTKYRVVANVGNKVLFVGEYELNRGGIFTRHQAVERAKRGYRKLNGSTKTVNFSVEMF
jgi:hypothetical protein